MIDRPNYAREIRRTLIDVPAVVRELGLDQGAVRQGRGMSICCPWHGDRNPSCSVRPGKDGTIAIKCHGCGKTGDVLHLVAAVFGLDIKSQFRDVLLVAAEKAFLWEIVDALEGRGKVDRPEPKPRPVHPPPPPTLTIDRYDEIACALAELCPRLDTNAEAVAYLEGRRVYADAQAAGCFALPTSLSAQRAIVAGLVSTFGEEDMALSGLLRGDGFAWRDHIIVVPWRTRAGLVSTVQRRRLSPDNPRYVFASDRSVLDPFGAEHFDVTDADEIIFCESAFDALARRKLARERGERTFVMAVPSATTWRAEWVEYARDRHVVLSLDADKAGEQAAKDIHAAISDVAASVTRETPAKGKDMGEIVQEVCA